MQDIRWIFITGGVVSSLGKGLVAASLGASLQAAGFRVRLRKFDPYLNVDPGTMSPRQHGEVFVTDDGAETDLDIGHYERFTGEDAVSQDAVTAGQIYQCLIANERQGKYLGKTVQVIPHVTDMIKEFIKRGLADVDFVICEIGGTVGDIESLPFLEAIRQFRNDWGVRATLFVHVALVPYLSTAGENKTKPAQHSVKELQRVGIQPDLLVCRCSQALGADTKQKLSLFCNILPQRVIEAGDVQTVYQAPVIYHEAGLDQQVLSFFGLSPLKTSDLLHWKQISHHILNPKQTLSIGIVGKYLDYPDAYKSLEEALVHAGILLQSQVSYRFFKAESFEDPQVSLDQIFDGIHGLIVPGGFDARGVEGKIRAIQWARENRLPFLGICLGMQMAVIETARHIGGLKRAHSEEFLGTDLAVEDPVICSISPSLWKSDTSEPIDKSLKSSIILGAQSSHLVSGTLAHKIYESILISERHRNRYQVNPTYHDLLQKSGLVFSGALKEGGLISIVERKDHPWFMGVQFHPEFKSRPFLPHPLFVGFLKAVLDFEKKNSS